MQECRLKLQMISSRKFGLGKMKKTGNPLQLFPALFADKPVVIG